MSIETTKEIYLNSIRANIHREGIDDLVYWLENTDFFTAPASTRHHGAHEGGLAEHSLHVYEKLQDLHRWGGGGSDATQESIAIVSLFHDICKAGCYKTEMRWRKNKLNQWEQYPTFVFDEEFAYGGHGSKSVFLVQSFMQLSPEEASAINCHMGQWDSTTYSNPTEVYKRNKLAWLLHVADEYATYYLD